jgi:hypothetical protein
MLRQVQHVFSKLGDSQLIGTLVTILHQACCPCVKPRQPAEEQRLSRSALANHPTTVAGTQLQRDSLQQWRTSWGAVPLEVTAFQ